jgi:hypothetical protein
MALANGDPAAALSISRGGTGVYDENGVCVCVFVWCVSLVCACWCINVPSFWMGCERVFPHANLFFTSLIMGRNESEDTRDPGCI